MAQRRSQDIQKAPIAVTALDEAGLTARGIQTVADLGAVAPNESHGKGYVSRGQGQVVQMDDSALTDRLLTLTRIKGC